MQGEISVANVIFRWTLLMPFSFLLNQRHLAFIAGLGLFCSVTQSWSCADQRPNFLFIAIDDLNSCVGFMSEEPGNLLQTLYPDPDLRDSVRQKLSPNIDRLAGRGRPFLRAYCPSPLCGPSRTALLTGVPTHVSGYYGHRENFRNYETLSNVVTLPQRLRSLGYYTAGVGKVFHKPRRERREGRIIAWPDAERSWDSWIDRFTGAQFSQSDTLPRYSLPISELEHFGPSSISAEETRDFQNARFIGKVLQRGSASIKDITERRFKTIALPKDKPFFLACGIFRPHLPWVAPKRFFDLYPASEMALDADTLADWCRDMGDVPTQGRRWSGFTGRRCEMTMTMEKAHQLDGKEKEVAAVKQLIQAYLACVTYADACVGELLQSLARSEYADNTIIVLWSDHGYHLGEKYRMGKAALWEEAGNCVLIIYDPDAGAAEGEPCRRVVSLQDIYPTVLARADANIPKEVAGNDLTPLLNNPSAKWSHSVLTTWTEGQHSLRTQEWRLIRYRDGDKELYHNSVDPDERENLASDSRHAGTLKALCDQLQEKLIGSSTVAQD